MERGYISTVFCERSHNLYQQIQQSLLPGFASHATQTQSDLSVNPCLQFYSTPSQPDPYAPPLPPSLSVSLVPQATDWQLLEQMVTL